MNIKNKVRIKRILCGVAIGGCCVAAVLVYFFFPTVATNTLKSTTAIVAKSWNDTFGGTSDTYISEIDVGEGASSTETTTDILAADTPFMGDQEVASLNDAARTESTSENNSETVAAATASVVSTIATTTEEAPLPQCTVAASANLSRKVIINEVAWMGSVPLAGETASAAVNREWIELKNISGRAIDVSRWQILDAAEKIKITFDIGTSVPAGGFLLAERGEVALPGVTADKTYTGALSNTGGVLALFDDACNASDVLNASDGWPAGNNTTKQTLERDADGVGWHTSVAPGGTPRAENSVAAHLTAAGGGAPSTGNVVASTGGGSATTTTITATTTTTTATSTDSTVATTTIATTTNPTATSTDTTPPCTPYTNHLVIAVVQIAGAASGTSANDLVKIFNPTTATVDVSGWKLRKKSNTGADYSLRVFPEGSGVVSGGFFVWANSANSFGDSIGANVTSTETLAAGNSVALFDTSGTVIDAVAWGEGTDQYVEGAAYPTDPSAGQALRRKLTNGVIIDTNNNTSDFVL